MNQDPIGLEGGDNIYLFSPNIQSWIDPLGLLSWNTARKQFWKAEAKRERNQHMVTGLEIRTTRKTGGLLTGYKPVVLGQRLKALAFTTFKPHSH